jgi:hypothetical protein
MLTVSELRQLLDSLPPDLEVLTCGAETKVVYACHALSQGLDAISFEDTLLTAPGMAPLWLDESAPTEQED